jgi:hypothetical protein
MCRLFTAVNDVAQIDSFWPSCGCHHGRVGRPVAENPHRPGIHGRCASRVVRATCACSRMVWVPSAPGWRPNPQYIATPKSEM